MPFMLILRIDGVVLKDYFFRRIPLYGDKRQGQALPLRMAIVTLRILRQPRLVDIGVIV